MDLPDGLYDQLLTESLRHALVRATDEHSRTIAPLSAEDAPDRLAEVIAAQIARILDDLQGDGAEKLQRQLELANALLVNARQRLSPPAAEADPLAAPLQLLQAVHRHSSPPALPDTGLALPWLFTAGKGSPSLLSELRRELAACNQVDILVSFITHSGVRKLLDILQSATAIGADGQPRTRLRILTTTYTGATEIRALDELAGLPGCEIRVSLDGRRTRLHAKAWLFQRRSGFGSAYVGSANLSGAALMGGLEWTVKFTERGQSDLFGRAQAHFETLWEDSEFQPYDPANPQHRAALGVALQREAGDDLVARPTYFDLQPKAYQQQMLDQLHKERDHGRWRNLRSAGCPPSAGSPSRPAPWPCRSARSNCCSSPSTNARVTTSASPITTTPSARSAFAGSRRIRPALKPWPGAAIWRAPATAGPSSCSCARPRAIPTAPAARCCWNGPRAPSP